MDIFSDNIEFEDVDFSVYYNQDGEPIRIEDMDEMELVNVITTLERQIRMLPEHVNVEIWKEYLRICKLEHEK